MADQNGDVANNAQQVPPNPPAQIPQAAVANNMVMAVALKLPSFWHKNARFWFTQVDSQFHISGITSEETKFHHVVRILDADTAEQVMDKIATPRKDHEYKDLKAALLVDYDHHKRDHAA